MAILLSLGFLGLSFFYISVDDGMMAAFFMILSAIAYVNSTGGNNGSGPDDQRMA